LGELVAVREELTKEEERFAVVPADVLLDLPAHPAAPENLLPEDAKPAADFHQLTSRNHHLTALGQPAER